MTPQYDKVAELEDVEEDEALKGEELLAQQAFQIKRLEQRGYRVACRDTIFGRPTDK